MSQPNAPASFDPRKKALTLFDEFKNFAFKGNVIDLAVGVIIGAAFGNIVSSLVDKIIMPLVAVVMPSDKGYQDWAWTINGKAIPYGEFLAEVMNFLIVALVLFFFIVKFLGWLMKSKEEAKSEPALPSAEEQLLMEIRDLLKAQQG